MTGFDHRPTLRTILTQAHQAGYTTAEVQDLSGAYLYDDPVKGIRCHRTSDYLKLRRWWLWRFHPAQAKAHEIDRPPVRFDPKEPGWDGLLRPPGSRGTPRFE